jgi:hypothetical protein
VASSATAGADDKALKGASFKVDDLKVTELKVPGKATLPCMLWVDPEGSAFLTLEGGTGRQSCHLAPRSLGRCWDGADDPFRYGADRGAQAEVMNRTRSGFRSTYGVAILCV